MQSCIRASLRDARRGRRGARDRVRYGLGAGGRGCGAAGVGRATGCGAAWADAERALSSSRAAPHPGSCTLGTPLAPQREPHDRLSADRVAPTLPARAAGGRARSSSGTRRETVSCRPGGPLRTFLRPMNDLASIFWGYAQIVHFDEKGTRFDLRFLRPFSMGAGFDRSQSAKRYVASCAPCRLPAPPHRLRAIPRSFAAKVEIKHARHFASGKHHPRLLSWDARRAPRRPLALRLRLGDPAPPSPPHMPPLP